MKARLTSLVVFALVLVACVGCTPDSPTDDQLTASGASTTTPTATAIAVVPITAPMSGPLRIWQRPGAVIPTDARCIDVIDALLPLALAEEVGAEMIFIGSHGRVSIERFLLGSTSEVVVREARCPVMVVRERTYKDVELEKVVEYDHPHDNYIPPHRYSYVETRLLARPADWPLI